MIRTRDAPEAYGGSLLLLTRVMRLLVVALLACLWCSSAGARNSSQGAELDLLGAIVNEQEVTTLLVLRREKQLWLPILEFGKITAMDVTTTEGDKVEITTPLGAVSVPPAHVRRHETILYVDERFLSERLNFRLEHVASDATLRISPAWQGRKAGGRSPSSDLREPEVFPPAYGLSTLSGTVFGVRDTDGNLGTEASLRLRGFAYDGVWQAAYVEDAYGDRMLRDFSWARKLDAHSIVQLGHQTIALHPLLSTQELTGVQWGWSSQSIDWRHPHSTSGALLNRWGSHRRSFSGRGPIGGFAELWIDDRFIARRDIGLDGRYAFDDALLVGRHVRVEVRVFDHRNPSSPVDIVSSSFELSELLLDPGKKTLLAGAGWGGNVLDGGRYRYDIGDEGAAGFVFGRWGVTSSTTLEAAATAAPNDTRIMAGVVSAVLPGTVVSGAVAAGNDDRYGYDASVNSERGPWRLIARSFRNMVDTDVAVVKCSSVLIGSRCDEARWGHDARITYAWSPALEIGLMAQHDVIATFALPYVRWQPTRDFRASVRPDRYGDYRLDASYRATPFDHFALAAGREAATTTYTRRFVDPDLTLTLGVGYDLRDDEIEGLVSLAGRKLLGVDLDWRVGVVRTETGLGLELSVRRELWPGVQGVLEASTGERFHSGTELDRFAVEDTRIRAGLAVSMGFTGDGSINAVPEHAARIDTGSIAGRVAPQARDADLSGIPVLVDGDVVTRTAKDGTFLVTGVQPGNRLVTYEEEQLPLEHVAKKRSFVAKVVPGAVTSMIFPTEVLYGSAGRITTRNGKGVPDATVVVLDAAGKEIGRATTNAFGYYRVDNLKPGRYEARLLERGSSTVRNAQTFEISKAFVFDIDLRVAN